jgi:4-hydroxy-2-oxoheptanedioate aldolase
MSGYTKQRVNRVKNNDRNGDLVAGVTVQLSSPEVVEMCGASGYDFVWIDAEHGSFELETAVHMFRAADAFGMTPLFRVPNHEPSLIMRALDAGAMGVIVPNVSTRAQAQAVVSAARYKMDGNGGMRGACPGTRATSYQTSDWNGFATWSNANVTVWALIETTAGVKNIDEILTVEGIDAIALGPFDLAHEMGFPGQVLHPEVTSALELVVEKAQQQGVDVVASLFSESASDMSAERAHWFARGVRMFSVGSDRGLVTRALREWVAAARRCE